MSDTVRHKTSLCAFDYLTGTIATAYKGPVQSLVISDFCIDRIDDRVEIRGRIIDLPPANYTLSLISEGKRLSQIEIKEGEFYFSLTEETYSTAVHLQIDITQKGRHIGTFLIKSPASKGPLLSAVQVAQELEGLNLRGLVRLVEDRVGLKKKAEHLVSSSLSAKRQWADFSVGLYSFSKDIFWTDRMAFSGWLAFIIRFFLLSIQNLSGQGKPLSDLLSIIDLIAEAEETELTRAFLRVLESEIKKFPIDIGLKFTGFMKRILKMIEHSGYPSSELLIFLTESLYKRLQGVTTLSDRVIELLGSPETLRPYSADFIQRLLTTCSDMIKAIRNNDLKKTGALLEGIDLSVLDESLMVKRLFSEIRGSEKPFPFKTIIEEIASSVLKNPQARKALSDECTSLILTYLKETEFSKAEGLLQILTEHRELFIDSVLFRKNLIESIFQSGDIKTQRGYLQIISEISIPPADFKGYNEDTWEPLFNKSHLEMLGNFITVITSGGYTETSFLTRLTANLYMIELFIPDEAVFQRYITDYLNSVPIKENFILHYLLLKRLPVFYNEVGASGRIRDLSTELDSWGNDPVLYFLRKQVHVNNGPQNINLVEMLFRAWHKQKLYELKGFVPDELLDKYPLKLVKKYSEALRKLMNAFGLGHIRGLLKIRPDEITDWLSAKSYPGEIKEKLKLLILLYQELNRKYSLSYDISEMEPELLINEMSSLKSVFTSSKKTMPEERLYYKRHIAFGIPSVMGTYKEEKFDALKEFLKREESLRLCLEGLSVLASKGGCPSLEQLLRGLNVFHKTFQLIGCSMPLIEETLLILKRNELHISQIIDIIRGLEKELIYIVESFYRWFLKPVSELQKTLTKEQIDPTLRGYTNREELTDVVIRKLITSVPGLQEYDRFLNNLLSCFLEKTEAAGDPVLEGITPEPGRNLYLLDELIEEDAKALGPLIGSKAKNLAILIKRDIPVPCAAVLTAGFTFDEDGIEEEARRAIKALEEKTDRVYGGERLPLFVSVRSGSYISMPGILDSILYCGMSKKTLKALIDETGDRVLGWDSYRRFLVHYLTVVHGLKIEQKNEGHEPEEACRYILSIASQKGVIIPDDPWKQLYESVRGVYRSWQTEKSRAYRKAMNISEHWGTAVLLMPMVQANSEKGGASVFFTRDPRSFDPIVFGETRMSSTGDDIVYGGKMSMPISSAQAGSEPSLEALEPDLYRLHAETARKVEEAMEGIPQEIEAAYIKENQRWRFYILQSRNMEFYRSRIDRFHEICRMESNILTRGIGVHGGALSGVATFEQDTEKLKNLSQQTDTPLILIRRETSTSDAERMPYVEGLLTSTGGVTSHASVLAKKFDLTAVVGCSELLIDTGARIARIGEFEITEGTAISIDGATGLVYKGTCPITVKDDIG